MLSLFEVEQHVHGECAAILCRRVFEGCNADIALVDQAHDFRLRKLCAGFVVSIVALGLHIRKLRRK